MTRTVFSSVSDEKAGDICCAWSRPRTKEHHEFCPHGAVNLPRKFNQLHFLWMNLKHRRQNITFEK